MVVEVARACRGFFALQALAMVAMVEAVTRQDTELVAEVEQQQEATAPLESSLCYPYRRDN
jgi:hypothetical protein